MITTLVKNIVDCLGQEEPVLLVASPDLGILIEGVKSSCPHVVVVDPNYVGLHHFLKSAKFKKAVYLLWDHKEHNAEAVALIKGTLDDPDSDFTMMRAPSKVPEGWNTKFVDKPKAQVCNTDCLDTIGDLHAAGKRVLIVAEPEHVLLSRYLKEEYPSIVVVEGTPANVSSCIRGYSYDAAFYLITKGSGYVASNLIGMENTLRTSGGPMYIVEVDEEGLGKVEYKKMEASQEDMVLVPRSLLNEAAVALENKAWADETIASLRSYASSEKQKSIIHIIAGDEDWEPTLEDLESLCDLFMGGLEDSEGAVIVTRKGVRAQIEYAEEADIHNSSVKLVRASVNPDIKYHALNPVVPEVSFDDSDVAKELISNCATVISKLGRVSTLDLHREAFELEKNFGVIRAAMILLCKRKIMCKERIHHLAELKLNEWN